MILGEGLCRVDIAAVHGRNPSIGIGQVQGVRGFLEDTVREDGGPLSLLSLRLRLIGRTPAHGRLTGLAAGLAEDFAPVLGSASAHVERVFLDTAPALDLTSLAAGQGPPALLARLLLDLEERPAGAEGLAAEALERVRALHAHPAFEPVRGPEPAPAEAVALLRRQGLLLLDALMAQKEAG